MERGADGDEEEAQQQPLEGLNLGLELVAVFALRQHHAGHEGAERGWQPKELHEAGHREHQQQRNQREDLAGAGAGEQSEQGPQEVVAGGEEGTGHDQGEEQLEKWLILLPEARGQGHLRDEAEALDGLHGSKQREEAEDGDDGEVLGEQDGEGGLAAAAREEVPLVERGEDDGSGGHRPDEAERHGEVPAHTEGESDGGDGGGGYNDLESSEADDVAAEGAEDGRLDL